jgi:hypothetical protein
MTKNTGCPECNKLQKEDPFPSVRMCAKCRIAWNEAQIEWHKGQIVEIRNEIGE